MAEAAQSPLKVSVVATVLNEESTIGELIQSLAAQSRPPDEVIIADGGSTDGTVERIVALGNERLALRVLQLTNATISEGRNAAIGAATGEIIAVTDAGVKLKSDWLRQLVMPFEKRRGRVDVVSGFFEPDPHSTFELAMGSTVLPNRDEINPARFLPSSRSVAFTKEAWRKAGGYPEWLDYCEDVVFDMALRQGGSTFGWAPEAVALFRPRSSLTAFWKQYFRYARGDGKANLWPERHAIRYVTYLGGLALLLGSGRRRWLIVPLSIASALHLRAPYRRLLPRLAGLSLPEQLEAIAWVPVIRLVGDLAKMAGYPAGVLWRLRHR